MVARSIAVAVAGGLGLGVVSCSSGPSGAAADVAATTCDALREINNRIVAVVNSSVAGVGEATPERRLAPMLAGLDEIRAELGMWDARIDQLDLPDVAEVPGLRAQLHEGVADAMAELGDQSVAFAMADGPVPDDEVAGVVGTWFNSVEKVVSSLEPQIFRFERREFKQAFLDQPGCRNVIQQFVND